MNLIRSKNTVADKKLIEWITTDTRDFFRVISKDRVELQFDWENNRLIVYHVESNEIVNYDEINFTSSNPHYDMIELMWPIVDLFGND